MELNRSFLCTIGFVSLFPHRVGNLAWRVFPISPKFYFLGPLTYLNSTTLAYSLWYAARKFVRSCGGNGEFQSVAEGLSLALFSPDLLPMLTWTWGEARRASGAVLARVKWTFLRGVGVLLEALLISGHFFAMVLRIMLSVSVAAFTSWDSTRLVVVRRSLHKQPLTKDVWTRRNDSSLML